MNKLYVVYKNGEYLDDTYVYSTYDKDKAYKVAEIEECCTVQVFISEYDVDHLDSKETYKTEIRRLEELVSNSNTTIAHKCRVEIVQHKKIVELERQLKEVK